MMEALGAADYSFVFGNPGDKPFVGDFNGNGKDTIGLHRESTGLVYFRNTNTQGSADQQFIFGDPGDRLVAGDWNRDRVGLSRSSSDPAIRRCTFATQIVRAMPTSRQRSASRMAPCRRKLRIAGVVLDWT